MVQIFHIIQKHATCAKIKTFENLFWTHLVQKSKLNDCEGSKMALYRFFKKQVPEVPSPYSSLSGSISPAAITGADRVVKRGF